MVDEDRPVVTVRVPGLLARFTGGRTTVAVRARSGVACLDALVETYPALAPHLFDGQGQLRPHLNLFLNGSAFELEDDVELTGGDEVVVLQAVSGGSQRLRPPRPNG